MESTKKTGYLLMICSAFDLGDLRSGIYVKKARLDEYPKKALAAIPWVLVEKSMLG